VFTLMAVTWLTPPSAFTVPRSEAFETWAWAGVAMATAMAAAALLHASTAASERARNRRAPLFRISCENVTASSLFAPAFPALALLAARPSHRTATNHRKLLSSFFWFVTGFTIAV
jgi:hypothetical protein